MEDRDTAFWEEQYCTELAEPFDWLFGFHDWPVEWWDRLLLTTDDSSSPLRVLLLGCGHAALSIDLAYYLNQPGNRGAQVVSVDSSKSVIDLMREKDPGLEWHVADCRDLCGGESWPGHPFADASFDIVIDKALLDAVLVYRHAGGRREAELSGAAAAREAARVLRPGGKLIVFSCLRDPAQSASDYTEENSTDKGVHTYKGADGYGGGRARPYACVRGLQPRGVSTGEASPYWWLVNYEELQNPRRKVERAGQFDGVPSDADGTLAYDNVTRPGPIAPQFDDVCPTHYALIVAQRASIGKNSAESPGENFLPIGQFPQPVPQLPLIVKPLVPASASYDDPSLNDYDDFYSGRLMASPGEAPAAPDAHDAFLSFEDLEQPLAAALDALARNDGGGGGSSMRLLSDQLSQYGRSNHGSSSGSSCSGPPKLRVLDVGMGSSAVGLGLVERFGFEYTGIDAIPDAVFQQQRRHPSLRLAVADARTLRRDLAQAGLISDGSCPPFDVLFDKGTADALLLFENPCIAVTTYANEAAALLNGNGCGGCGAWVVVTCLREEGGVLQGMGPPRLLGLLQTLGWQLAHHQPDLETAEKGATDRTYDLLVLLPPVLACV